MLDNARFAPSGGNRQGWRVIVVTDPDTRRRLRELYEEPWHAYTERTGGAGRCSTRGEARGVPAGRLRMLRAADEYAHTFDRAPVHLVICVELDALAIVDRDAGSPEHRRRRVGLPVRPEHPAGPARRGPRRGVHDAADAGRAGGPRAARDPGRDRARRPHLGRPPRRPVAEAARAATGQRVRVRRTLRRAVGRLALGPRPQSRRVRTPSLR